MKNTSAELFTAAGNLSLPPDQAADVAARAIADIRKAALPGLEKRYLLIVAELKKRRSGYTVPNFGRAVDVDELSPAACEELFSARNSIVLALEAELRAVIAEDQAAYLARRTPLDLLQERLTQLERRLAAIEARLSFQPSPPAHAHDPQRILGGCPPTRARDPSGTLGGPPPPLDHTGGVRRLG
jgi:hypothetical protein